MAGEKTMENPKPVTAVLKSEAVAKLAEKDVPSGKLGMPSDSTSMVSPSTHPSSGMKGESHQDFVGEPGVHQPTSVYDYYYPGYNGSFTQSDDKGYFPTDGSHAVVQSENGSLVYYLPGYSPYATGTLMGVDGQCVGQQPYFSSGYFQPPVSYGSEAIPCYPWDSTYAGDVSNGNFDGFENVKYGSASAFAKSNGFNSMKSSDLGAKLSKSTYTQPNRPLSKVNGSGQFVGLAEMIGKVDFNKDMDFWQMDKWNGFFPIKWHVIKDIPNKELCHIILENNENKPVTHSRDTQEIGLKQGLEMLNIFKSYSAKTSVLDDFEFYENRGKILNAKKNYKSASLQYKEDDPTKQAKFGERNVEEDLRRTKKSADATSLINLTKNLSLNGYTRKSIAVKNPTP